MESLMTRTGAALMRQPAELFETTKAATTERARAAIEEVRRRAAESRLQARERALAKIDEGRDVAAARLAGLADALRPAGSSRRRAAVIAGGSGAVLVAAVGLGVAFGYMMSRRKRQREQVRQRMAAVDAPPAVVSSEPLATPAGVDLVD